MRLCISTTTATGMRYQNEQFFFEGRVVKLQHMRKQDGTGQTVFFMYWRAMVLTWRTLACVAEEVFKRD